MQQLPLIHWLSQITKDDADHLGSKAANLGEMSALGMPVPNGFVIDSQAYFTFLAQSGLTTKIENLLKTVNIHDATAVQKAAITIQSLIKNAELSEELVQAITVGYHQLSSKDVFVAVRSSVVATHSNEGLFDGRQSAHLNVLGKSQLLQAVKSVWASLYEPRAIYYRIERGYDALRVGVAVVVQRMVESEVAGVVFSADPISNDADTVVIEAVWGLGDTISSGDITPDHYIVGKKDWNILKKDVVRQEWQLMRSTHKAINSLEEANVKLPVSIAWQRKPKLSDRLIIDLAKISQKLEHHFGIPQDVEWAYANHTVYLVQTHSMVNIPMQATVETVSVSPVSSNSNLHPKAAPLLTGMPAANGTATGRAMVVDNSHLGKLRLGEDTVLVCKSPDEDLLPYIDSIQALVTNDGGSASSIVMAAREKGLPVVIGTVNGTKMVKDGEALTVDGTHGYVYEGHLKLHFEDAAVTTDVAFAKSFPGHTTSVDGKSKGVSAIKQIPTATKVMINLAEPAQAESLANRDVDGVGLLRAEFMINALGEHPKSLLERRKESVLIEALYEGIRDVAKAFAPRPIVYRLGDLTANQHRKLHGGEEYEVTEDNPALGYRGAMRYATDVDVLKLEIQAIKKVRQYYKNVWLMLPFVRTPEELIAVKSLISEEGLYRGGSFKLFMMAEVPSNVILLDQFIGAGIDGISIGSNDLTQLILGVDRHNPRVAPAFDERNDAVMWAMERLVTGAISHGIMCSICGQAPTMYPEITRKLVEWGITSVSVSPEAAGETRRLIANAEFELVRQGKTVKRKGY